MRERQLAKAWAEQSLSGIRDEWRTELAEADHRRAVVRALREASRALGVGLHPIPRDLLARLVVDPAVCGELLRQPYRDEMLFNRRRAEPRDAELIHHSDPDHPAIPVQVDEPNASPVEAPPEPVDEPSNDRSMAARNLEFRSHHRESGFPPWYVRVLHRPTGVSRTATGLTEVDATRAAYEDLADELAGRDPNDEWR